MYLKFKRFYVKNIRKTIISVTVWYRLCQELLSSISLGKSIVFTLDRIFNWENISISIGKQGH